MGGVSWLVEVPASVANLGSGFDGLGVALALYLRVEGGPAEEDVFLYHGEGRVEDGANSLVHRAWRAAFQVVEQPPPPLAVRVENPIPLARGLGSSAAAAVAGAALADLALGGALGRQGVFEVAATLEGHPDNAGASAFGGLVVGVGPPWQAVSLPLPEGLLFAVAAPPFTVPTEKARRALPAAVPLADAVFNLTRAALWPAALAAGRLDLLKEAARDRLHQPYRLGLMPGAEAAIEAAYAAGALAAFVGGAGPAVAALVDERRSARVAEAISDYARGGTVFVLAPAEGYTWKAT